MKRTPDRVRPVRPSLTIGFRLAALGFLCTLISTRAIAVEFSISEPQRVLEGDSGTTLASLQITRSDPDGAATVEFFYSGTAAFAEVSYFGDYGPTRPANRSFTDGQRTIDFTIEIYTDRREEPDKEIEIRMEVSSGPGEVTYQRRSTTITIEDDDAPVEFSLSEPVLILEGDAGATEVPLQIRRSDPRGVAQLMLNYTGSARFGSFPEEGDYGPLRPLTRSFADGQSTIDLVVMVFGDVLEEASTTIEITIEITSESPDSPSISYGRQTTSVQIVDDDGSGLSSQYADWIAQFGLSGEDAALGSDPDRDGNTNLSEYLIGGSSPVDGKADWLSAQVVGTNVKVRFHVRDGAIFALKSTTAAGGLFAEVVPSQPENPQPPGVPPNFTAYLAILDAATQPATLLRVEADFP